MVKQRTIIAGSSLEAPRRRASRAFSLVEIMVVIALLSVIILGLMAMFDQTQKAFRAGMAQTDQMEGARMFSDLLQRDMEQIEPSYQTNTANFIAQIPGILNYNYIPNTYVPLQQTLPPASVTRTNILQDLFFISRANQTWSGIGYFVRTNPTVSGYVDSVGTLYRFQTNIAVGFGNPQLAYQTFLTSTTATNSSKILDGVVEFHVRCYDTNGVFINQGSSINNSTNFVNIQNWALGALTVSNEVQLYAFSNNIVPAYVEVEFGILEPAVLKKYDGIPPAVRSTFLANHAGNVQVFRQRIPIRNVDPAAY